jgi:16S rRNA processing protein RimM
MARSGSDRPGSASSQNPEGQLTHPPGRPSRIRVGRILGAHGLKGALRIKPDNLDSIASSAVNRVTLELAGISREYELRCAERIGRGDLRIRLQGIEDASAAEALKGAIVSIRTDDLPAAGPGEFYYFEAIGCDVFTTDGRHLGVIADIFSTGANDVWVVREGSREVLVPVIEDVVKSMDLAGRRMTIEAVPGLLD